MFMEENGGPSMTLHRAFDDYRNNRRVPGQLMTDFHRRMPAELVALFALQMLETFEKIHCKGRILHCDSKTDNWVLVYSTDNQERPRLKLIDFGRAKRLEHLQSQFLGEANNPVISEMMCLRMKKEGNFGVEQDFFSVCKIVYLLLVGKEMEGGDFIDPEEGLEYKASNLPSILGHSGRGRGSSPRWLSHADLWSELFLTLLNFNPSTNSYEKTVGDLCKSLRKYVNDNESKIDTEIAELRTILKIM